MGQAKVLTDRELKKILLYIAARSHATRNRCMFLLTHGSGMRVGEVAALRICDVLLKDGIVHTIGHQIQVGPDVAVIDASGLYVLPGGVDTHVHLENVIGPTITCDTFASGTRAAAFGGTTTVVDFALQTETDSPLGAIARAQASADAQVAVDYSLHVIVTRVDDQVLKDVRHAMRHEGVTSFKMFMAYPNSVMVDDAAIFRAMRMVGQHGGMILYSQKRLLYSRTMPYAQLKSPRKPLRPGARMWPT